MKIGLLFISLFIFSCASSPEPDLTTSENRYKYLMNGLADLAEDDDVGGYCFASSALGQLDSLHQHQLNMACGNVLYNRGEYIGASIEYLSASNEDGITKQQLYDAYMGMAYSDAAPEDSVGSIFLIKNLEEKGIEYGPEAVALNLNAVLKSYPRCSVIAPLVEKLTVFESWEKFMNKETHKRLMEKCGEI